MFNLKLIRSITLCSHSITTHRRASTMASNDRFLLTGGNGWICGHLHSLLEGQGKTVLSTTARMEDLPAMKAVFDDFKPTRVINCAGKTGRPNVDWCEDHRQETVMSNVVGTIMLANLCDERDVHLTNLSTGCKSALLPSPIRSHLY